MVGAIPRNRPHCVTVRNAFQVNARCPGSPSSVNLMKKAVVGILNRVPVVLIVIGEALVIYLATAVAKPCVHPARSAVLGVVSRGIHGGAVAAVAQALEQGEASATVSPRRPQLGAGRTARLLAGADEYPVLCGHQQYGYGHCRVYRILGPLSVAVITGKSWRERVGIGIAAVGVVLLAGISLANPSGNGTFLYGLIAILIGGSMWGMYIITGRRRGGWRQFAG